MAPLRTKRRSARQAATKKRSVYAVDLDTDSEVDYQASGSDAEDVAPPATNPIQQDSRKRQRVESSRANPQTRSKSVKSKSIPRKKAVIGASRRARRPVVKVEESKEFRGPSDGHIPDWVSLPPAILRDIFVFASHPSEDGGDAANQVKWLMNAAHTCRTFATPALEAYYESPALLDRFHPHHFLELLRLPKEKRYMDYNVKVRRLNLSVRRLAYQAHNKTLFDLGDLVKELPQLQHFEILHPIDQPPYRPLKLQNWNYPPDLFTNINATGIKLRSWRWSRDFIHNPYPSKFNQPCPWLYELLTVEHGRPSFQYLERLVMCGFDKANSAPSQPSGDLETSQPSTLATSIGALPRLKDLTFISCDLVRERFLQTLPNHLERLEITNCQEVNSEMIVAFLTSSGSELRELVLNHNMVLDLAFLPFLKSHCPKLEVLKMDLKYYSELHTVMDAEPLYDDLLMDDELPSWPSTMRQIDLVHLQKFQAKAGENFFSSLVDSAKDLPDLRRLVLHTHINIPWRDRAGFRDRWISRLQRVYCQRSTPPVPYLGSLKQFRLWRQAQQPRNQQQSSDTSRNELAPIIFSSDDECYVRKTLSHVRVSPRKPLMDEHLAGKNAPPRRSSRVAESQASAASLSGTPAPGSDEEAPSDDHEDEKDELFVQGLCEVVDIRIDNQRPRENQFTEGDFLDDELSGDEDWQEGTDNLEDERYAW